MRLHVEALLGSLLLVSLAVPRVMCQRTPLLKYCTQIPVGPTSPDRCCSRCDNMRANVQVAGIINAFQESEEKTVQLGRNLSRTVEVYWRNVTTRGLQIEEAARNDCASGLSQMRLHVDTEMSNVRVSIGGLSETAAHGFRTATSDRNSLWVKSENMTSQLERQREKLMVLESALDATNVAAANLSNALKQTALKIDGDIATLRASTFRAVGLLDQKLNQSDSRIGDMRRRADQQEISIQGLGSAQQRATVQTTLALQTLRADLNATWQDLQILRADHRNLTIRHEELRAAVQNISQRLRECPTGWNRTGAFCHTIVLGWPGTWADARSRCKLLEGELARVYSSVQNDVFRSMQNASGVGEAWLGGTDSAVEGTWKWVSGDEFFRNGTAVVGRYINFGRGEPNNNYYGRATENCLAMTGQGTWSDMPCALNAAFFCEIYRP